MIVKLRNIKTDGWVFFDNILSVKSDFSYCIKKTKIEGCKDYPDHFQTFIIGTYEDLETGVLKQNENVICFPDLNLIPDFESDTYLTENIFRIKILEIEFVDKTKYLVASHEDNIIYLLSNEGKTIDRL